MHRTSFFLIDSTKKKIKISEFFHCFAQRLKLKIFLFFFFSIPHYRDFSFGWCPTNFNWFSISTYFISNILYTIEYPYVHTSTHQIKLLRKICHFFNKQIAFFFQLIKNKKTITFFLPLLKRITRKKSQLFFTASFVN